MSIVDPISDMLTRVRNAYAVSKESVQVPTSNTKEAVLSILKKEGYIEDYSKDQNMLNVVLKYDDAKPVINSIERVSKPGRRVYVGKDEIPVVLSGQGIAVLSTSKGIMTGADAKAANLGGEVICRVY